jgi:hypothetical protein
MKDESRISSPAASEVTLPIKLDAHTFARLRSFSAMIGKPVEECASALFIDLILDEEFETAPSWALH